MIAHTVRFRIRVSGVPPEDWPTGEYSWFQRRFRSEWIAWNSPFVEVLELLREEVDGRKWKVPPFGYPPRSVILPPREYRVPKGQRF